MPILYSDNKLFAVNTKTQSILYSKNAKHGLPLRLVGPPQDGYYPYTYAYEFGNDCLQFAESLVTRIPTYSGRACQLKDKKTNVLFGVSDAQNERIARTSAVNEFANPNVGEAYAMVNSDFTASASDKALVPYHIAYVMFKDGNSDITLEADAGRKKRQAPIFDIYKRPARTFHRQTTSVENPATVVLTPRG